MKKTFLLLLLICNFSIAQDSLYKVFSIIGSLEEPISAINALGDINHDGYDDFILRKENTDYCEIYFGSENIDLTYTLKLFDQPNMGSLGTLINVGDLNNDGYNDYAQSGYLNNGGYPTGKVFIFYGSSELNSDPDWSLQSSCIDGFLGASLSGGDFNGDGKDDLVISEPYNWCDGVGKVFLFEGSNGFSNIPLYIYEGEQTEDFFGEHVCLNGDINGDGLNDLIISAPNINGIQNLESKIFIYFGDLSISNVTDTTLSFPILYTDVLPYYLDDFNGDGFDDFYVTIENKLFFGSIDFNGAEYLEFVSSEEYDNYGQNAGSLGDINNDGYSDILLGATGHKNTAGVMVGASYIHLGSSSLDTTADFFLEGETKWSGFGYSGGLLGDINSDGFVEFYISAFKYPDIDNKLGKVYVYSMKDFVVGVDERIDIIPKEFILKQNHPNPFNPTTQLGYQIPKSGFVNLVVYNPLGQVVSTLVNEHQKNGKYSVQFNASNLPSGVYFYKLHVGEFSSVKKMLLTK